ncbi:MAG: helix-turn-helix transcriptional regulator, partial [Clostridia bacterium]|nr:helix-turn-helix transcriptional regulator [Clostridia bacterium]
MTMRIFLANLGKIRSFNGWDMDDMYERLGFVRTTYYNWKSGKSKPSLSMLEQIARNANITVSDLLREGFTPGETNTVRTEKLFEQCRRIDAHFRTVQ